MDYDRSVALVGRPNVGKSRLFNNLVGKRISIVHDQPGVTRDIIMAEVDEDFLLMDTGGIGMQAEMSMKDITQAVEDQVQFAIGVAQVVVFVVDAQVGILPEDEKIAKMLKKIGKRVIVAANKVDDPARHSEKLKEFYRLGFGGFCSISAEHNRGISELLGIIHEILGPKDDQKEKSFQTIERLKICFAGRPNVGKSSLGNALLKMDRLIVSDVPGTTRESVRVNLDYKAGPDEIWPFQLIDTAGLKPSAKVGTSLDYFSNLRTTEAYKEADVVFQVLDARVGVAKLDKKLAGDILASGRSLVIVVNKWDYALESAQTGELEGYANEKEFKEAFETAVRRELFFLPNAPILFVSAQKRIGVQTIIRTAHELAKRMNQKFSTSQVNKVFHEIIAKRDPRHISGKRFKLYYAVQTGNNPFRIRLYCNFADRLEPTYERYVKSEFVKAFALDGCPVEFDVKGKSQAQEEKE